MKIDPRLRTHIDSRIMIAKAAFPDSTEQELIDTSLLVLAGLGLAKSVVRDGAMTWVPTALFEEESKMPLRPIEVTSLIKSANIGDARPNLSNSLKLIIENLVAATRPAA